jgi:dTDP-4-amino-4,6-dideoxygalactose transaminase
MPGSLQSAREAMSPNDPIPFHRPSISGAERDAAIAVLDSGWLTTGQRSLAFEGAVAAFTGAGHAIAVSSATAALHLALEAIGIGPDDEVVVPTYTFAACGEVVRYLGARPRLADVDPVTLNVTAETLAAQLTERTRALMVVHFGGLMADMAPILELAAARGLPVIEDAAHALPSFRDGRAAGTLGVAGALSFYATKTVTTGEGGMLLTDDDRIADRARVMRLHGISRDAWLRYTAAGSWYYEIEDAGFKYNLTDIAAAIGLVQLERAEEMRRSREHVAEQYALEIASAGLGDLVELPASPGPRDVHAWHLYPLRLNLDRTRLDRGATIDLLKARGIGTSVHFIPLHLHPYYRRTFGYAPADLPIAAREYGREISLPIFPGLGDADVQRVVEALAEALT